MLVIRASLVTIFGPGRVGRTTKRRWFGRINPRRSSHICLVFLAILVTRATPVTNFAPCVCSVFLAVLVLLVPCTNRFLGPFRIFWRSHPRRGLVFYHSRAENLKIYPLEPNWSREVLEAGNDLDPAGCLWNSIITKCELAEINQEEWPIESSYLKPTKKSDNTYRAAIWIELKFIKKWLTLAP